MVHDVWRVEPANQIAALFAMVRYSMILLTKIISLTLAQLSDPKM